MRFPGTVRRRRRSTADGDAKSYRILPFSVASLSVKFQSALDSMVSFVNVRTPTQPNPKTGLGNSVHDTRETTLWHVAWMCTTRLGQFFSFFSFLLFSYEVTVCCKNYLRKWFRKTRNSIETFGMYDERTVHKQRDVFCRATQTETSVSYTKIRSVQST